jgi:hypothetical protein
MAQKIALLHSIEKSVDNFFASIITQLTQSRNIHSTKKLFNRSVINQILNYNLEGEVFWLKTFIEESNPPVVYLNNNLWEIFCLN